MEHESQATQQSSQDSHGILSQQDPAAIAAAAAVAEKFKKDQEDYEKSLRDLLNVTAPTHLTVLVKKFNGQQSNICFVEKIRSDAQLTLHSDGRVDHPINHDWIVLYSLWFPEHGVRFLRHRLWSLNCAFAITLQRCACDPTPQNDL